MIVLNKSLNGKYFSCDIPDVEFSIQEQRASVMLTVTHGDASEVIYDEILYPYGDGLICLTDLGSLLSPYAEQMLIFNLGITIKEQNPDGDSWTDVNSQEMTCDIMFSAADVGIPAEEFYSNYFLSILVGDKITSMGRLEYLHYYGSDVAEITAEYDDGSSETFPATVVGGNDDYKTIDVSPERFIKENKTLVSFNVSAGSRLQRFIVDTDKPDCAPILLFTNSFGVQEIAYCTGTHQVSPVFSRSSSRINGLLKNYKIEETRTFKADTGVLNTAMANWFDDVFRSKEIYIMNVIGTQVMPGKEVVITESKSENSNEHDAMPRFSFEYQYAQKIHNVLNLQRAGRIFDNTFDNTFN